MAEVEFSHPTVDAIVTLLSKFTNPAFPEEVDKLKAWKAEIEDAVSRETVAENESLQIIVRTYLDEIKEMEEALRTLDSTQLTDKARDRLLDKIALYRDFCKRFDVKEIRALIESVDKVVRETLEGLS